MHGSNAFDAIEFVEYLRDKRFVFLTSCTVAVVLTAAISLTLPKLYAARASILIDAPQGNDPRAATSLTSVYLDSLKSFESFASSDTLFQRAAAHLHISEPKAAVLQVTRPAGSTILEITATLRDPRRAQELAQYVAEQAVALNGAIDAQSATDLRDDLHAQSQAAQVRLEQASHALQEYIAANPIAALENELREGSAFEYRLEQDLETARTGLAELSAARDAALAPKLASLQARIAAMESQHRDLSASLGKKGAQLDIRTSRREQLENDERSARAAYEEIVRDNDIRTAAHPRGGRLHIIDPGIVPAQPVSPNVRRNVAASLLASLAGTFLWLALRFGYIQLQRERSERVYSLR